MTAHDDRDLDGAFELPETIQSDKLRELYEIIVARMRYEARELPMNTVQQLLIERIAMNYIVLRAKERGELGGFAHSTVQKDFNTFWLNMTSEFNRLLGASQKGGADRKAMLREMQEIIVKTVNKAIRDPHERAGVLQNFAAEFEKQGI